MAGGDIRGTEDTVVLCSVNAAVMKEIAYI